MKRLLLILLSFYAGSSFAQNEYMHWGINDYQINFCNESTCSGTSLNSINKQPAKLIGSATICDKNTGQLLFFTDGTQVFNANMQPMPNSQNLGGSYSTQAALIVPKPGSERLYYIFTTVRWGVPGGLSYSIVDMKKDGGLGDVTVKKQLIDSITDEKLTAVYNADQDYFWVIAHDPFTGNFLTYKVDANGFNSTPVQSPSHVTITNMYQTAGYMKASPDGKQVACVWEDPPVFNLYNFDKNTGQLSMVTNLPVEKQDDYVFGTSFSPDNSKLYVTAGNDTENYSELYQFDLVNQDSNVIKSSRAKLANVDYTHELLGMQLGPDQKLYIVRDSLDSISVVNYPNLKGSASKFVLNQLPIPAFNASAGLANNIDGLYYYSTSNNLNISYTNNISCNKDVTFAITTKRIYDNYTIDFGDGTPQQEYTGAQYNFEHTYANTGNYTVKLYSVIGEVQDSAITTLDVLSGDCNTTLATPTFTVPTLLTPYANGFGNRFIIPNLPNNTDVAIYDTYGQLVFRSLNYQGDWNIVAATPQMYFYVITTADGKQYKGKLEVIHLY